MIKRKKKKEKNESIDLILTITQVTIFIVSILFAIYVGGFILFIQPIVEMCKSLDTGTLTAVMVGVTVLKCMFASAVGTLIYFVGLLINYIISEFRK